MKRRILAILIAWVLIVSVGTAETFDSFDSVDGFFMWDEPFFAQEMVASASIPLHGTDELINKVYDGSADKLFAALLGRKKLSAEQIEKLKQIVGELE